MGVFEGINFGKHWLSATALSEAFVTCFVCFGVAGCEAEQLR